MAELLPLEMRCVGLKAPGGPEQLCIESASVPVPKDGELLIRVAWTALNRADTLQRKGAYPPPADASPILGLECAGVIAAVGPNCDEKWQVGDRVAALLSGGGYAEYTTAQEGCVLSVPAEIPLRTAAAVPEAYLTAWQLLSVIGGVKNDQWVLVHAGASGVGVSAIQLAVAVGAKVIATAGSADKCALCMQLGASHAVNYSEGELFEKVVAEATGGKGVDLILDSVGASYALQNLASAAMDSKWVLYATMGGSEVDKFPLAGLMRKRLQLIATTLRTRSKEYKAALVQDFGAKAFPLVCSGAVVPVIDSEYRMEQITEAHELMESNKNKGKILIAVNSDLL